MYEVHVHLVGLTDYAAVSPCQFGLKLSTDGKGSLVFGEMGAYILLYVQETSLMGRTDTSLIRGPITTLPTTVVCPAR